MPAPQRQSTPTRTRQRSLRDNEVAACVIPNYVCPYAEEAVNRSDRRPFASRVLGKKKIIQVVVGAPCTLARNAPGGVDDTTGHDRATSRIPAMGRAYIRAIFAIATSRGEAVAAQARIAAPIDQEVSQDEVTRSDLLASEFLRVPLRRYPPSSDPGRQQWCWSTR